VPRLSLCVIKLLGDLLEICCRSEKSRSSAKISDHAAKTPSGSADLTTTQREMIFWAVLLGSLRIFPAREASSYRPGSLRPRKSPRHAVEKSRPLSRVLSWTVIPLGCASPRSSSDLPGSLMWATCAADRRRVLPYLVLLQVGFAVPLMLPPARCALTAPFHPYRHRLRGT
jgi:hypothetical protein